MSEIEKKKIIYEKITFCGVDSLNDTELIAIILGKGEATDKAMERAKVILEKISKIENLSQQQIKRILCERSITPKEKCVIESLFEIAKRVGSPKEQNIEVIRSAKDVFSLFNPIIGSIDHEEFWIICTNRSCRIIDRFMLSKGGKTTCSVDLKIAIKRVINSLADSVILVHNHPSQDLEPSLEDLKITEDIKKALSFFDILLSDHIIIGTNNYYSFRERHSI